jgi:hypothetical protein
MYVALTEQRDQQQQTTYALPPTSRSQRCNVDGGQEELKVFNVAPNGHRNQRIRS